MKAAMIAAVAAAALPTLIVLTALFGYFGGWMFGLVFNDTWAAIHTWLNMPSELTAGMFGAFCAAFGACFGKPTVSSK